MAIGQRIRFFRNRKEMTQKQLGEILGFLGKTSDVRMAQYESEARIPKQDLVKEMAHIFGINTHALNVPDIDSYIGLMHTLFAIEDMYGLKVGKVNGELCLRIDRNNGSTFSSMYNMLNAWQIQADKLKNEEITQEEYDEWRYKYPELDTTQHWGKVIPQGLSDMLMDEMKKIEKKLERKRNKHKNNLTDIQFKLKISKVSLCQIKINLLFE